MELSEELLDDLNGIDSSNSEVSFESGCELATEDLNIHDKLRDLVKRTKHENNNALIDFILSFERDFRGLISDGNCDFFLLDQLQPVLQHENDLIYNKIVLAYNNKFKELETIIPGHREYVLVVKEVETNLESPNFEDILTKEQVLLVTMTMGSGFHQGVTIERHDTLKNIERFLRLNSIQTDIVAHITNRIRDVAPNVCAIVGDKIAAKLVAHTGGIKGLSETPSCNIASIGKTKHLSHAQQLDSSGVRQQGYIFQSSLVQNQDTSMMKQALRMVCAKVSLAARVDCGHTKHKGSDILGLKWREEIETKLAKLQDPPNFATTKPLPIPEDKIKKTRAGRKFRKYKEKFQLSHLRQLQNRVEFGVQEEVAVDAFGEEIGLGMAARKTVSAAASMKKTASLRKPMKQRFEKSRYDTDIFWKVDDRAATIGGSGSET